jgi:large subunit ribosomal protein L29
MVMNISELQGKTPDQLKDMVLGLKKELFNLRFQRSSGELTNTSRFRQVRNDIARVYTFMNQPETAGASAKPAKKVAAPKAAKAKTTKAKKA